MDQFSVQHTVNAPCQKWKTDKDGFRRAYFYTINLLVLRSHLPAADSLAIIQTKFQVSDLL